mmetsp:Transcript_30767/g.55037  ORF Transcript_30767/g.55037 Transcript_30767/m.55037 type:complete len:356 (-) Transcript_30767:286-1353(-)
MAFMRRAKSFHRASTAFCNRKSLFLLLLLILEKVRIPSAQIIAARVLIEHKAILVSKKGKPEQVWHVCVIEEKLPALAIHFKSIHLRIISLLPHGILLDSCLHFVRYVCGLFAQPLVFQDLGGHLADHARHNHHHHVLRDVVAQLSLVVAGPGEAPHEASAVCHLRLLGLVEILRLRVMMLLCSQQLQNLPGNYSKILVQMGRFASGFPGIVVKLHHKQRCIQLKVMLVSEGPACRLTSVAAAVRTALSPGALLLVWPQGVESRGVHILGHKANLPLHDACEHGINAVRAGSQGQVDFILHGAVSEPHLPDVASGHQGGVILLEDAPRLRCRELIGLLKHPRQMLALILRQLLVP